MRFVRRTLLLVLAAVLAAGPALAADKDDAPKAKRRSPPVAAKPVDAAGLRPTQKLAQPAPISLPAPLQSGGALLSGGLSTNGLASAGLRSGLPAVGDPRAQCRTGCTQARFTCDAQDGTPDCAPRWAMCVAACSR